MFCLIVLKILLIITFPNNTRYWNYNDKFPFQWCKDINIRWQSWCLSILNLILKLFYTEPWTMLNLSNQTLNKTEVCLNWIMNKAEALVVQTYVCQNLKKKQRHYTTPHDNATDQISNQSTICKPGILSQKFYWTYRQRLNLMPPSPISWALKMFTEPL